MSKFSNIKEFINSKKDGDFILRKDMLEHLEYFNALDTYRQAFSNLGYLSHPIRRGVYIKLKDIPKNFTATHLSDCYRNRRFRFKHLKLKNNT